jgi:excisionase family DNA binding protein
MAKRTAGGAATQPRLVTVSQVASLLAVSHETVRKWIARGTIPYIVLPHDADATRNEYRIPLQGLLTCLSGNYDLSQDLDAIHAAAQDVDVLKDLPRRPR